MNIQQRVDLYSVDYQGALLPGYIVVPETAKLAITDGQHRRSGIIMAFEEMGDDDQMTFGGDAVAVMITCESDVLQVHQDFADCSKVLKLPPSMLAAYDMRNPANRLVLDITEQCPLFKGRIDSTSKALSKKSTCLFLANQIRQLIKELLVGSCAMPDLQFEKMAVERLSRDHQYADALQKFVAYLNHLSAAIPVWQELANLPDTLEAGRIIARRAEGWICLTATGLNVIGRIGYHLFGVRGEKDWMAFADRLAALDWSRDAPLWQGNIVTATKRIANQQGPLKAAVAAVRDVIGIEGPVHEPALTM